MFALAIDNAIPGSKYWNKRLKVEYKSLKKIEQIKVSQTMGSSKVET